jgi:cytochrome b561
VSVPESIGRGGQASDLGGERYDSTSIWMHWVTAATVLLLWILGQTIDWFPRGTPRTGARTAHILLGATLGVLLIARIAWRARRGRRLAPAMLGSFGTTARVMHWLLYVLVAATIVLGISNAWIRGDTLLGLFKIPSLAPGDKALRQLVEDWHGDAANIVLIAAGLHALMALLHHFYWKDGVLRRMLPR